MSLQEKIYSVLLVSSSDKFNSAIAELLPTQKYCPVCTVTSINAAKKQLSERNFDIVIINAPLPDDMGVSFAIDTGVGKSSSVLLLVRAELYDEIHTKVTPHGVFTITKPVSKPMMGIALDWLCTARERLYCYEKKSLSLEEKMEEIRIINKAKWILISVMSMDEAQAHRYIEKQAMDRCVTKRKIADEIIQSYS